MISSKNKIINLKLENIFNIVLINKLINEYLLFPLIQIFKYKINFNRFIIKFKT